MKKISLILLFIVLAIGLHAQTVDALYLNPKGGTGDPYAYTRFGTPSAFYAGLMWNNTNPYYGNGDDFSIFTYNNRDISFYTGTGNLHIFPRLGGRVGIGTTSPRQKLDVNGAVRCREIIVEASPWPDFVFEAGYRLPPLAETESYIKTHGHLPGIPSAQEVTNEGLSLGDINAKLLQKIEEMTLHQIALSKQIAALKKQTEKIESLEAQIKNLKTQKQ